MYARSLESQYGMPVVEYERRIAAQNGRCAICGDEPDEGKRLHQTFREAQTCCPK